MTRCNMCMGKYTDDIIECPDCFTDAYLMDMNMWTKYDYVCSDCDALIEITTLDNLRDKPEPQCPCGSNNTINISVRDVTIHDESITLISTPPVTNITSSKVVKINTNPYN